MHESDEEWIVQNENQNQVEHYPIGESFSFLRFNWVLEKRFIRGMIIDVTVLMVGSVERQWLGGVTWNVLLTGRDKIPANASLLMKKLLERDV